MEKTINKQASRFRPTTSAVPKIYVIHENEEWVKPLWEELNLLGIPFESWFIDEGSFDLTEEPPLGIFYNRMSASSHTRGHRYAVEFSTPLITWLEAHGRTVINGANTLQTEVNKANQYLLLQAAGITTPRTQVANNQAQLVEQAVHFEGKPFIVKPNRGGKGLGVQLFHSVSALETELANNEDFVSPDGIYLIQEYIESAKPEIVRMEFINAQFYYAVAVNNSGGFELCPADACSIEEGFCPTDAANGSEDSKFKIIENFENPDLPAIEAFLKQQRIDIAGVEFITDVHGNRFVYDINTNTNYNGAAEQATGYQWKGMRQLARYLVETFYADYP